MITGIYGIFVGAKLVYIGKSKNMVERRSQHWSKIYSTEKGLGNIEDKYRCLVAAKQQHMPIAFKIIKETDYKLDDLEKDYIKTYKPYLNTIYGEQKPIDVNEFLELMNATLEDTTWLYIDGKAVGELDEIPTRVEELTYKKKQEKKEEDRIAQLEQKVDSLTKMVTKLLERLEDAA